MLLLRRVVVSLSARRVTINFLAGERGEREGKRKTPYRDYGETIKAIFVVFCPEVIILRATRMIYRVIHKWPAVRAKNNSRTYMEK